MQIHFFYFFIIFFFHNASLTESKIQQEQKNINSETYMHTFYTEFLKYDQNNIRTDLLQQLISYTFDDSNIRLSDLPNSTYPQRCLTCRAVTYTFLNYYNNGNYTELRLKNAAKTLCTVFEIGTRYICDRYVEIFAADIKFILENKKNLQTESICATIFQVDKCGTAPNQNKRLINIDSNGKHLKTSKKFSGNPSVPELTIVQITDPHYDPNYIVGGNAKCKIGACCNRNQGLPESYTAAAGFWGDYNRCDTPKHALINVLNQIKKQHQSIDAIYFTGDIVDHFTYDTSKEGNTESFKLMFKLLEDTFPAIPIYPILGNHEAHPVNLYAPSSVPENLQINWLYELSNQEWSRWLPANTSETIIKAGYYTTHVRPGLRIIGLNNNFCYFENYWLLYDDEYFKDQLQWFHDVLLEAEKAGDKVHVLAHVPINGGCYKKWSYNYNLIIERFANTISAQFNGHTHADEFNLNFASYNKGIVLNVAWNGGSANSFIDVNPNYSVYQVDGESFEVIDYTTWIYNLTKANLSPDQEPDWFQEYSFKNAFNVPDLSPASLIILTNQFLMNDSIAYNYWQLKMKQGDPKLYAGCNSDCLRSNICEIIENNFHEFEFCGGSTSSRAGTMDIIVKEVEAQVIHKKTDEE